MKRMRGFSAGADEKIGWYVYRLVDPRNGETFYVGKGKGDRLFDHEFESDIRSGLEPEVASEKIARINRIRSNDLELVYIVHRHGMDEKTAFHVEAALIDAYPGLTNLVRGKGADYGVRSFVEIDRLYRAEEAVFADRAILLISIGDGWLSDEMGEPSKENIFEQAHYRWVLNLNRAKQASVILAHAQGLIRGAFVAKRWYPSNARELSDHARYSPNPTVPRPRFGFIGALAPPEDWRTYVGKRVPSVYRKARGQPIQYAGSLSSKKKGQ